jgi:hypothetical protein
MSCLYLYELPYYVSTATRELNGCSSILDLLLCDNPNFISRTEVVPGVSDHHAILTHLNASVPKDIHAKEKFYNY